MPETGKEALRLTAYAESDRSYTRMCLSPIRAQWHLSAPKAGDTGAAGRHPIVGLERLPPEQQ